MANAGNSSDSRLFDKKVLSNKMVLYSKLENCHQRALKHMMNDILAMDEIEQQPSFRGKTFQFHTAFYKKSRLMIKMNQYRLRNWYFEPLCE